MDILEKPKEWLWHVALKKVGAAVAGGAVGLVSTFAAKKLGIQLTPDQTTQMVGWLVTGGAATGVAIHDALKLKYGDLWWGKILL